MPREPLEYEPVPSDTGTLNAAQALDLLNQHGGEARSDYNDGDDVLGWFGWEINDSILTVTYQPDTEDGAGPLSRVRFRLQYLETTITPVDATTADTTD